MLSKDYILKATHLFQVYYKTGQIFPVGIKCYSEYIADMHTVYPVKSSYLGTLHYKELKGRSNLVLSLKKAFKNREPYVESYICTNHYIKTDDPDSPIFFRGFEDKYCQILYVYDEVPGITESERKARALMKKHYRDSHCPAQGFNTFLKNTPVLPVLQHARYANIKCSLEHFSYASIMSEGIKIQLEHPELFRNITHTMHHTSVNNPSAPLNPWVYEDGIRTDIPYLDFSSVYYYRDFRKVRSNIDSQLMQYLDFKRTCRKAKPSARSQELVTVLFKEAFGLMCCNIASGLWPVESCSAAGIIVCLKELLYRSEAIKYVDFKRYEMNHVLLKFNAALKNFDSKLTTGKISMLFSNYLAPYTHENRTLYPKMDEGPESASYTIKGKKTAVKKHNLYKYSEAYKAVKNELKTKTVHTEGFINKYNEKSERAAHMVTVEHMTYSAVCSELKVSKPTLIKMLRRHASRQEQESLKKAVDLLSLKTYEHDEMTWETQHQLIMNGIIYDYVEAKKTSDAAYQSLSTEGYVKSKDLKLKKYMTPDEERSMYESCKGAIDNVFNIIEQYLDKPFILQGI